MNTVMVVGNRTLGSERLLSELRERIEQGASTIHVLVPASPDPRAWSHDPFEARKQARVRLDAVLERFEALECAITGEIGDPRPVDAVIDTLRENDVDEIIVSTLAPGASRWLGMDVVSRINRAVPVPVSHVADQEAPVQV